MSQNLIDLEESILFLSAHRKTISTDSYGWSVIYGAQRELEKQVAAYFAPEAV